MNQNLQDFIETTSACETVEAVGGLLLAALRAEGFENLVFAETRHGAIEGVVWAELPPGYIDDYVGEQWGRIDPVFRRARTTTRAFVWDHLVAEPQLTSADRRFMARSETLGVKAGLTAPIHEPGGRVGILSASMRIGERPPLMRLRYVHALAIYAWLRRNELTPRPRPAPPHLSERELECLKWLKDGKTNFEIGEILSVSEKTVEFHVGNVLAKLRVNSRVAAVMTALKAQLIEL